ncbi:hypothetical protein GCM10027598_58890 [Amycolatopsis oliviviridis]|uniref:Uncharacterized protein n=1 Tax=Amycolatopsis oliviviridis TaxID=1471590 RepID=A0ABQ3LXF1_9PSEU|nr:hypothetical protein [Amycolatopsis oliviviridis]GHH28537.1 hypothetical protein GCM10017790_59540 [Amycolatopsis oliviviridis]
MTRNPVEQVAVGLVAEWRNGYLLIRQHDEHDPPVGAAGTSPVPGQAFVLVSPAASQDPALSTALPALLYRKLAAADAGAIRIGLAGLGKNPLVAQALADVLDKEIFAPDGTFVSVAGGALYAGYGTGGTGWIRFRPGSPSVPGGLRHPLPQWEEALPSTPVTIAGARVEPIPAGVLVRRDKGQQVTPADPAFAAVVDFGVATIVVPEDAPDPATVAAVVTKLSPARTQLAVLPSFAAEHPWLRACTTALGRDVAVAGLSFAAASGGSAGMTGPFVAKLRQRVDGAQEVIEAAEPPAGWQRHGRTGYRLGDVLADVVPSGVVLRTGPGDPAAGHPPFSPYEWTLYLGTPGVPIKPDLLHAAETLLAALAPEVRDVARLQLSGVLDDRARASFEHVPDLSEPEFPARPAELADPRQEAPATARRASVVSRPLTVSAAPVPTISGAPTPLAETPAIPPEEPAAQAKTAARSPEPAEVVSQENEPGSETSAETGQMVTRAAPGTPVVIADRSSAAAEQARFAASAGELFTEALATVNAALATWPSMRQEDTAGVKADFVAVCLYLGRGAGNSHDLNEAVRSGTAEAIDDHVHCLVSGLRRLPTHRRAVLRQSKAARPLERTVDPGVLLTEPGFLCGSADLDVMVPGADLDVLIWPASARRTSALRIGQSVNEVVFFGGARFKALAVRTAEPLDEPGEERPTPRDAALFRELAPDEPAPVSGELDEYDLAALAKLDRALETRRRSTLRVVEEPDVTGRLTSSMLEWRDSATVARTATLAS